MTTPTDFHIPLSELRKEWQRAHFLNSNNMAARTEQLYLWWYVAECRADYWQKRALEAERKLADAA